MKRADMVFCAFAALWLVVIASSTFVAERMYPEMRPSAAMSVTERELENEPPGEVLRRVRADAETRRHDVMRPIKREVFVQRVNGFATLLLVVAGVLRIGAWSRERLRSRSVVPAGGGAERPKYDRP